MTIEVTPLYPSDLNAAYPAAGDNIPEGDDHIRNLKTVLKTTLPNVSGAITPTHTVLNYMLGVTGAVQTQIDTLTTAKATIASPTFTGTPSAPTAAAGTATTQLATTDFVASAGLSSSLPGQLGNGGKVPTTDGTTATWTDALKATVLRFVDGADATKKLAFDVSGVSTATTRTVTLPDKSGTLAMTSDVASPGLVLLSTITAGAAATVDIETGFGATYDNYMVVASGVKSSSGAPFVNATLKIGGSYIAAGYDATMTYNAAPATALVFNNSSNAATAPIGLALSGANDVAGMTLRLFDVNSAIGKVVDFCSSTANISGSTGYYLTGHVSCRTAGVLSGIRIQCATGTITGVFKLYGIAKV